MLRIRSKKVYQSSYPSSIEYKMRSIEDSREKTIVIPSHKINFTGTSTVLVLHCNIDAQNFYRNVVNDRWDVWSDTCLSFFLNSLFIFTRYIYTKEIENLKDDSEGKNETVRLLELNFSKQFNFAVNDARSR